MGDKETLIVWTAAESEIKVKFVGAEPTAAERRNPAKWISKSLRSRRKTEEALGYYDAFFHEMGCTSSKGADGVIYDGVPPPLDAEAAARVRAASAVEAEQTFTRAKEELAEAERELAQAQHELGQAQAALVEAEGKEVPQKAEEGATEEVAGDEILGSDPSDGASTAGEEATVESEAADADEEDAGDPAGGDGPAETDPAPKQEASTAACGEVPDGAAAGAEETKEAEVTTKVTPEQIEELRTVAAAKEEEVQTKIAIVKAKGEAVKATGPESRLLRGFSRASESGWDGAVGQSYLQNGTLSVDPADGNEPASGTQEEEEEEPEDPEALVLLDAPYKNLAGESKVANVTGNTVLLGRFKPEGQERIPVIFKVVATEEDARWQLQTIREVRGHAEANADYFIDALDVVQAFDERLGKKGAQVQGAALVLERGGDSLAHIIKFRHYRLRALGDVIISMTAAVDAVHAAGHVWTDVTPRNFVADVRGGLQRFKAVDLVGMRRPGDAFTERNVRYCPPEFYQELRVIAARSFDSWGLGLCIFQVLTGSHALDHLVGGADEYALREFLMLPYEEIDAQVRTIVEDHLSGPGTGAFIYLLVGDKKTARRGLLVANPKKRATAGDVLSNLRAIADETRQTLHTSNSL